MHSGGFIEGIYNGSLERTFFDSFKSPGKTARVQDLLARYGELIKEYPPDMLEETGRIPEPALKRMGEIGLFGITIPQEFGGLGFNLHEYMDVVEGMAGLDISVALASLAHLSIGTKGIVLFGTPSQKQKYLTQAASGEMIFSYALTEPKFGSDAQHIETSATLSDDGTHYILNGQKTYITNANYARGLTVFAQMDPEHPGFLGAFIVETGWDGVKIGKDMPKMGLKASSTASINFKDIRVPVENLLGKPGDGFKIAMSILNYGRLGLGAAAVGMMEKSVQDMLRRAASRIQFGVPIANFPLIQEKIVQAKVYSAASKAMNSFSAALLEENSHRNIAIETSHCKLFGTTRGWDTMYNALQVAGGAGYISTQPYEKRMRDFRVTTIFEGTTEIHSIYPALFAMRRIGKEVQTSGAGKLTQLKFLLQKFLGRLDWGLKFDDPMMNKAARFARGNARLIRRMLLVGSLLYGPKVANEEFFLRRITSLSLYMFALLATVARISAESNPGSPRKEDLRLLAYLLEEAREARRSSRSIMGTMKEKLGSVIFRDLRSIAEHQEIKIL